MIPAAECVAVACLGYGSFRDIKTREVPDTVWVVMGAAGVVLRVQDHSWKLMGISAGVALLLGFILAVSGLFGGADIKAFAALSLLIPSYPGTVFPVFIVSVFNNLAVLKTAEIGVVSIYNMVKGNRYKGDISRGKKLLLYMTGFPMQKEMLDYRFLPLHDINGTIHLLPDIDIDIEQYKKECTLQEIWVTYGSPLIAYLTAGCIIAFVRGDLILQLILYLLNQ
jgi:prepilin signal peptidase PulO-like enzyme (type II secretory pathway)